MDITENMTTRPLKASDLDQVVDIDKRIVGWSRRGFFQKRVDAAIERPDSYVVVGAVDGTTLVGYAIARIHGGDFGTKGRTAALDAVGVDPRSQAKGVGKLLMDALDDVLRKKEVSEIRTQADWHFHGLMKYFDAMGFEVAPAHILERTAGDQAGVNF
ncbi:MAG: GNAT family N-acetyltransferase [Rhodospirillaceae bacterium]|jgi:GNAT superfamily N-acetyltransferase|nr:GNAT family N-acetyltransferase [Rhodospirillaceae bacterium]MBT4590198.1 GNAT family N-acetyltransferase [Rhodospirillaceae bacterium]MBT4939326.1 GNAT family N-acetyltransferase [Rhodospirillaceae bacterium]MBT5939534.1 GNAT family N-acetyltransferase [Rhodospirillaceae bacterium]MBT7267974.1 GNAT family N-acetyltransferase [Rhodospirillaceae bacterium]